MLRRIILAAVLLLASVTPASAQLLWLFGETGNSGLECPVSYVSGGSLSFLEAATPRSGDWSLRLKHHASTSARGTCGSSFSNLAATGTIYFAFAVRFEFDGGFLCAQNLNTGGVNLTNSSGSTIASVKFKCTAGDDDFRFAVADSAAADIGSDQNVAVNTWYQVELKIVTGSGSASVAWRLNGAAVGSPSTGLTISNVDDVTFIHPYVLSGSDTIVMRYDDGCAVKGASDWLGKCVVNQRLPVSTTPTDNAWVKGYCTAGANAGDTCSVSSECPSGACATTINQLWTSPSTPAVSLAFPDGPPDEPFVISSASATDAQTTKFGAFDSGTPTPVIDAATTTAVWGCFPSWVAGRGTSTNRTYAIRRRIPGVCFAGSNAGASCSVDSQCPSSTCAVSDVAQTYSASTYALHQVPFDMPGASIAAKITNMNAVELGGIRTGAGGAAMYIEDIWYVCGWSVTDATSGTNVILVQDE